MKNPVQFEVMEKLVRSIDRKMKILFEQREILSKFIETAKTEKDKEYAVEKMNENYQAMLPVMAMIVGNYENARRFMDAMKEGEEDGTNKNT